MTAVVIDLPELPELPEFGVWLDPDDRRAVSDQVASRLQAIEVQARWCESELVAALDVADRHGFYSIDGHRTIRSWAAANVNWSGPECRDRARTVHLVRDVPQVGVDLADGKIGIAQVRELARLRANPRCGDDLVDAADDLVQAAKDLPFEQFKVVTGRWEQLADADGAHRGQEAAHEGRRVWPRATSRDELGRGRRRHGTQVPVLHGTGSGRRVRAERPAMYTEAKPTHVIVPLFRLRSLRSSRTESSTQRLDRRPLRTSARMRAHPRNSGRPHRRLTRSRLRRRNGAQTQVRRQIPVNALTAESSTHER